MAQLSSPQRLARLSKGQSSFGAAILKDLVFRQDPSHNLEIPRYNGRGLEGDMAAVARDFQAAIERRFNLTDVRG